MAAPSASPSPWTGAGAVSTSGTRRRSSRRWRASEARGHDLGTPEARRPAERLTALPPRARVRPLSRATCDARRWCYGAVKRPSLNGLPAEGGPMAATTDTAPSLTIVKRFNYRGDVDEEFSNTYHFSGTTPADAAAWKT